MKKIIFIFLFIRETINEFNILEAGIIILKIAPILLKKIIYIKLDLLI